MQVLSGDAVGHSDCGGEEGVAGQLVGAPREPDCGPGVSLDGSGLEDRALAAGVSEPLLTTAPLPRRG